MHTCLQNSMPVPRASETSCKASWVELKRCFLSLVAYRELETGGKQKSEQKGRQENFFSGKKMSREEINRC